MAYPYYSQGGQGDPSGYKRNMDYSYDGGSSGYLSRVSGGGPASYKPAPVPRFDPMNYQFGQGQFDYAGSGREGGINMFNRQMQQKGMEAQSMADLADRSATTQYNLTMEELRMKLEAAREERMMQMNMQREGWGNDRYNMRYGHLLKYGE